MTYNMFLVDIGVLGNIDIKCKLYINNKGIPIINQINAYFKIYLIILLI